LSQKREASADRGLSADVAVLLINRADELPIPVHPPRIIRAQPNRPLYVGSSLIEAAQGYFRERQGSRSDARRAGPPTSRRAYVDGPLASSFSATPFWRLRSYVRPHMRAAFVKLFHGVTLRARVSLRSLNLIQGRALILAGASPANLICGTARGARSFSIAFTRVDGAFICTALKHGT
jgi:hypothetical protein